MKYIHILETSKKVKKTRTLVELANILKQNSEKKETMGANTFMKKIDYIITLRMIVLYYIKLIIKYSLLLKF